MEKQEFLDELRAIHESIQSGTDQVTELIVSPDKQYRLPINDSKNVIFVIDTSGSMRNSETMLLRHEYLNKLGVFSLSFKKLKHLIIIDAEGNTIFEQEEPIEPNEDGVSPEKIGYWLKLISSYSHETNSTPAAALLKTRKIVDKRFKSKQASIFVFGDEYNAKSEEILHDVTRLQKLLSKHQISISFIELYNPHFATLKIAAKQKGEPSLDISTKLGTFAKYSLFGHYISSKFAGSYYKFMRPEEERFPETVLMTRLFQEHPNDVWELNDTHLDLDINRIKRVLGTDRFVKLGKDSENKNITKLDVSAWVDKKYTKQYHIVRSHDNEHDVQEYLVEVSESNGHWNITSWKKIVDFKD